METSAHFIGTKVISQILLPHVTALRSSESFLDLAAIVISAVVISVFVVVQSIFIIYNFPDLLSAIN